MSGGWLQGFGGGYPPRPRAPRPAELPAPTPPPPAKDGSGKTGKSGPLSAWRAGQVRAVVEVACCPKCGSLRVKIRTNRGPDTVLMECAECGHRWKDARAERLA